MNPSQKAKKADGHKDENLRLKQENKKEKDKKYAESTKKRKESLIQKNTELENECETLLNTKQSLTRKVNEYVEYIESHLSRGCKLTPELQELWLQLQERKVGHEESERNLATSRSSNDNSGYSPSTLNIIDTIPTATVPVGLFGGKKLPTTPPADRGCQNERVL